VRSGRCWRSTGHPPGPLLSKAPLDIRVIRHDRPASSCLRWVPEIIYGPASTGRFSPRPVPVKVIKRSGSVALGIFSPPRPPVHQRRLVLARGLWRAVSWSFEYPPVGPAGLCAHTAPVSPAPSVSRLPRVPGSGGADPRLGPGRLVGAPVRGCWSTLSTSSNPRTAMEGRVFVLGCHRPPRDRRHGTARSARSSWACCSAWCSLYRRRPTWASTPGPGVRALIKSGFLLVPSHEPAVRPCSPARPSPELCENP